MKRVVLLSALTVALGAGPYAQTRPAPPAQAGKTLDIYVADTEGGKAALFVSPTGQTLLIDSGNPGERDLTRILAMLSDAGVTKLDYLLSTHYHVDHIGGLQELSRKSPSPTTSITGRTPSRKNRSRTSRRPTSSPAAQPGTSWRSPETACRSPAWTGGS